MTCITYTDLMNVKPRECLLTLLYMITHTYKYRYSLGLDLDKLI